MKHVSTPFVYIVLRSPLTQGRRAANACQDYGQRIQFSVFECIVATRQRTHLRQRLIEVI
ncbi:MAG: CRISPR-associated endonuclease Cas2 [Nitrospirae bacterium]|nr:CRISPR-associated endonuclease Cas2 [Nitrospirota bacterium]